MNKKGIIAVIVIVILVIIGFAAFGGDSAAPVTNTGNETETGNTNNTGATKDDFKPVTSGQTDSSLIGRLKSASVSAAETGTRVALSNGKASFSEEGVKGTITLGDVAVEKTVGGKKFVVTSLGVNTGGASTYQYVVLFEDRSGSLVDLSYALLGDRAKVTGIRIDELSAGSLAATVAYTDASGASKNHIFVVENGIFNPAKSFGF